MTTVLTLEPLTRSAFAPFGDVIETDGSSRLETNAGTAERFHDLALIEVEGGRPLLSIFRCQPPARPVRLTLMERHPLASQAFFPIHDREWVVVVAAGPDPCAPEAIRAFRAAGRQGVNYARNTWHHPLITLTPDHEFLVIDRGDVEGNLEEVPFPDSAEVVLGL